MELSLHIFDLDGTLAETWGTELLPGVTQCVPQLRGKLAVATNQAGVVWNAVEGDPYPRASDVGRRLVDVAKALPRLRDALWFVSVGDENLPLPSARLRGLAAAVTRAAAPLCVRTSGDLAWRKPRPGMLLEACRVADVPRDDAVFVGDREVDRQAACAAGMTFIHADEFFRRA